MYGKIFESIYDGSLYGDWKAIAVLQQLIVLADEHGVVDMTPQAISGRSSFPLEIIEDGLKTLSSPDERSRSDKEDGKRIILTDPERGWGWSIVNYKYYRDLASRVEKQAADRARIAEKRNKNKDVAECRRVSQDVADVAHTDTYTDTKDMSIFDTFWSLYPRKDAKKKSSVAFMRLSKGNQHKAIEDIKTRYTDTPKQYVPIATTYINGERWEDGKDEPEKAKWI